MKHSGIATGAMALIAVAFSLAVAELVVRLALPPQLPDNFTAVSRAIRAKSPWPDLPYLLRPGAEVRQFFHTDPRGYFGPDAILTYRINSLGFRGPEARLEKPPGTFRILGLGDSFTFGTGVREEDTFLAVLRERLARRGAFEVWNLGIMGYGTREEVALLRLVGSDYAPDLVVITLFLNDAGGSPLRDTFNTDLQEWQLPAWRRTFRTADRLVTFVERRRAERALVESYRSSFSDESPGWTGVRNSLVYARELARTRGFDLALMIFPVLYQLSDGYPFEAAHGAVADLAAELEIPALDLLPVFRGYDGPELWVHPSNQHPNEVAHGRVADALESFLLEHAWIPQA